MANTLVSASWLLSHSADPNIRIVDTRFTLGKPDAGQAAYDAGHIPGAVFADLERHLCAAARPDRRGGRHPIPTAEQMEKTLSTLGISNDLHLIAYDDGGFYAPHFWWLMRYFGHENCSVLDGGLPAWIKVGGPITSEKPQYSGTFCAKLNPNMLVDALHVQHRNTGAVLVDSRAGERFRGEVEAIDRKAGHIPGAINMDWADGLINGHFKSSAEQADRFKNVATAPDLIIYCGSGVSAGANMLALELAGISHAKLYAGSWSDWISEDSRPIATGPE
jgi:thiosulfate/3-mercaptopyruvate sulfurtransferase